VTNAASGSVGWTYTLNSAAAQYLAEGETVTERYVVSISDGQGGSSQQEVAITITGSNDAPAIVAAGTTASGGVIELADNAPGENTAIHTAGGVIAFADVDLIDVHSAAVTVLGSGYLGTLTLAPVDQGANSVGWTFTVSDGALDSLAAGQVATQTYRVEISDGQGGTITQDVTVTLTGAGDAPVNLAPTDLGLIANSDVTKSGATIGTLYTIDPNAGDTFTYTLLSDLSQKFTIVGNQLKLVSGASLDFQGGNVTVQTYSLTIRTVDQGGLAYDEIINIVKGTNSQDTLTSQGGDDVIYGDGAKDIVHAASGNDYIFGQNGDDELFGEDGNDVLNGENNVDKLFGGAGNDTLNGGAGSDTLTGEDGDDVFLFLKGEGNGDRVADFTGANAAGGDVLRFEGYGAGATLTYLSGEDWKITYSGGSEIIKLTGVTALNSGDYLFV
jgi:VCBS repeat-containing protein